MISALILTLNEEKNLAACLRSVSWCDEVVVLDSGSTDRTLEIAGQLGVRILQRPFDDFASQRNYGLEMGELPDGWVLHLDADERVPPPLRDEIQSVVGDTQYDAYRVASRLMFQGRWLKRSGMYPSYQVRLGRRDVLRFIQVGHGQRESGVSPGRLGKLTCDLDHYSFSKGISSWIEKHNRYSSDEAELIRREVASSIEWRALFTRDPLPRRRALKRLSQRLPCRPLARFLYMYVIRLGFLDGRAGLDYCLMTAMYERMINLKLNADAAPARGLNAEPSMLDACEENRECLL